jgi:hypothetical protein
LPLLKCPPVSINDLYWLINKAWSRANVEYSPKVKFGWQISKFNLNKSSLLGASIFIFLSYRDTQYPWILYMPHTRSKGNAKSPYDALDVHTVKMIFLNIISYDFEL